MGQDVQERSWLDLPKDILDLIYSYVIDRSFCLMSLIEDENVKFYYPLLEKTYYESTLWFQEERIASSNFGWLLINATVGSLLFRNPFNDVELFVVPPLVFPTNIFQLYHFSSPPTSSDCTIIAMKNDNKRGTNIGIIKRGEEKWTFKRFNYFGTFKTSFCNSVFFDGRFYFVGDEFNIGIYDVNANTWKICDKHLVSPRKSYSYRPLGMVEDNGGILMVYESCEHQQLHVARFDLSKMIWKKVDCLGDDKVLYVSEGVSYLETAATKGMGNKIYFPKFHGSSGIFYSLATKKYHSCDGKYCSKGPYGLVQPRFSTWIIPIYSSSKAIEDSGSTSSSNKYVKYFSDPILPTTYDPSLEG